MAPVTLTGNLPLIKRLRRLADLLNQLAMASIHAGFYCDHENTLRARVALGMGSVTDARQLLFFVRIFFDHRRRDCGQVVRRGPARKGLHEHFCRPLRGAEMDAAAIARCIASGAVA